MLLAYRLVRLIETHSAELAHGLLTKVQTSDKLPGYSQVPAEELEERVYEIYRHLGDWLLGKSEGDIEHRYEEIGTRRKAQGVPFSQVAYVLELTKENLWEFLKTRQMDTPVEAFGELEMLQLLDQFFDRATYYSALGYEKVCVADVVASVSE
jgi:hypothetical protein